jgi:hypothetical protein
VRVAAAAWFANQRVPAWLAQRAGARITDVNAGHLSLISRANTVTRVILKAASATS